MIMEKNTQSLQLVAVFIDISFFPDFQYNTATNLHDIHQFLILDVREFDLVVRVDNGHQLGILPDQFLERGVSVHHTVEYTT